MTASIPASAIVQVNPGVISAGGSALDLNGVILTEDTSIPIGTVQSFASANDVSNWFGPTAQETKLANIYFGGRNNKTLTPGSLLFAQYNASPVSAYLRSGSLAAVTLTQLQALSGTLTITFAGTADTSSTIDLSSATSFSDAATLIEAAFTSPAFAVSYDSLRKAFVFTSTATGASETIVEASGTLAADLYLTTATGAVLSQGADAQTPAGMMADVVSQTLNWATFMTTWEPTDADKLAFAAWTNSQSNRYAYIVWETSVAATQVNDTTTIMAQVATNGYSGIVGIYSDIEHAAFVLGCTASIDFNRTNGRITYAFKYLSGLKASVTDETTANNLQANGYNFIGQYATANDGFTFFYPGQISGPYDYIDEYVDQVYLNSQLQLAVMELLVNVNSIPYNQAGYALIHAACMDPINQGLNFGMIVPGVTLSAAQVAEVNNAAGTQIDKTLNTRGWYLQIKDATAQTRGARQSPPITLWYMDGGAVQQIVLASILIQ